MVDGVKCSTNVEQSHKGDLGPIDSPINVGEEVLEKSLKGVAFPKLTHLKQVIYL